MMCWSSEVEIKEVEVKDELTSGLRISVISCMMADVLDWILTSYKQQQTTTIM